MIGNVLYVAVFCSEWQEKDQYIEFTVCSNQNHGEDSLNQQNGWHLLKEKMNKASVRGCERNRFLS